MTLAILIKFLEDFDRVNIYKDGAGYVFEADGEKYIGSYMCVEEAVERAYFELRARKLAKELVKTAKIVL